MKRRALVVFLCLVLLSMLVGCASMQKQGGATGEQGIIVRVAASGKIVSAVSWDGSELKYAPEDKEGLVGGRLAFFTGGKKGPQGFLKMMNGKWQKAPISSAKKGAKVGKGETAQLVAHISPDANVLSITNLDGTRAKLAEGIKPTSLRLLSPSLTCRCCISNYCYGTCPPCSCSVCVPCGGHC